MNKDETREEYIVRVARRGGKERWADKSEEDKKSFGDMLAATRLAKKRGFKWKELSKHDRYDLVQEVRDLRKQKS